MGCKQRNDVKKERKKKEEKKRKTQRMHPQVVEACYFRKEKRNQSNLTKLIC